MRTTKADQSAELSAAAKARKALAVYVRRGYESIEAFENQMTEEGIESILDQLAERDAAFANFHYHDRTAPNASSRSIEIDQLLAEAQAQNERLRDLLNAAMGSLRGVLGKINTARQVTHLYRSGEMPEVRFRKAT